MDRNKELTSIGVAWSYGDHPVQALRFTCRRAETQSSGDPRWHKGAEDSHPGP